MKYILKFWTKCVYTIFYFLHVTIQIIWNFSLDVDYRVLAWGLDDRNEFGWYYTNILTFWKGESVYSEELSTIQQNQQEEWY